MLRCPAKRPPRQRIIRDKTRRVTFSTWPVFDFEIAARDMPNSFKQLLYTCSVPRPKIEGVARASAQ